MNIKTFTIARGIAFIFALAIFLSTFASCKKSNDSGTPANTISATVTAPSGVTTLNPRIPLSIIIRPPGNIG